MILSDLAGHGSLQHFFLSLFLHALTDARMSGSMTLPPASPPLAASPQQFAAIATTISYVGIALIAVLIPLHVTVACCILRRRRAPPTTALRKMPYTVSISPKRCSPSGEEKRRLTNDEQPDAAEVITPQATIPISSRDGALSSRTVSAILQDMPAESVDASVGEICPRRCHISEKSHLWQLLPAWVGVARRGRRRLRRSQRRSP